MTFNSIADALEWLRMDGSASEAVLDVINANNLGIICPQQHFDNWLYLPEGVTEEQAYATEADKQYARELKGIESLLVASGLIYKENL